MKDEDSASELSERKPSYIKKIERLLCEFSEDEIKKLIEYAEKIHERIEK